MAGIVTMQAMYQALGCSNEVATFLTDEEGLESPEALAELDPADIRQLCKNIRNHGGGGRRPHDIHQGYAQDYPR